LRCRERLKIPDNNTDAKSLQNSIVHYLDELKKSSKRLNSSERIDMAVELGALWGQTLCDAAKWAWCHVKEGDEDGRILVASPNRSHVIDPIRFVHTQLGKRGKTSANTSQLVFNMISAGNLPPASPGAYREIA
jgi:hypothetical protein